MSVIKEEEAIGNRTWKFKSFAVNQRWGGRWSPRSSRRRTCGRPPDAPRRQCVGRRALPANVVSVVRL